MTPIAADELTVWEVHRGHIILLGAWLVIVAGVLAWSKVVPAVRRARARARLPRGPWLWAAAVVTALSAGIHLDVIGEHFEESTLYGTFFLVLAAAQIGWTVWLLVRPDVVVLSAGAAASLGVAMLWLATRTVGIPVGVAAGEKEAFGWLDVVASAAELAVGLFALAVVLSARGARLRTAVT